MKKRTISILAGSCTCLLITGIALSVQFSRRPAIICDSVPEFVMPTKGSGSVAEEYTSTPAVPAVTNEPLTITQTVESTHGSEESAPEPSVISHDPTAHTQTADTTTVPQPETAPSSKSSTSAADVTTAKTSSAVTTTVISATSSTPASTEREPAEPEAPQNILITSGDPDHHIRFEFGERQINFSGVYTGTGISDIIILRKRIQSTDLAFTGADFSGSLNVSSLDPGYYIIRVDLADGSVIDYVFEMKSDGSAPLSLEELPVGENLSAAASPLELPSDGVLKHITSSGDPETAKQVLSRVKGISDEICEGLTTDYDKLRAISEWVSRNMYYDKDASENGVTEDILTLEHVLEYHRSVCFGWSNLFSALCQAQGIWCANASGSVVTGSRCFMQTTTADERSHSWNMAVIDGRQIWVDTVWNSTNSYSDRYYAEGLQDMQYFDISIAALSQDHRVTRFEYRDYFALA